MLCFLKFLLALLANHAMSASASNVFLLAGQSNMSGRGGNYNDSTSNTVIWDGQIPPECRSKPEILQLAANKSWVEAHEPLHQEIDHWKTCGIGPGMPFANAILAKYPSFGSIGLVPCAKGGTRIMEWAKGTELYNQLVSRAKASLNGGGEIRALLWYQGESDTAEQDAKLYKSRLEKFFNNVRHDLNYPDLPIIMVAICSADQGPFMDVIRKVQLNFNHKNVKCVDAMGSTFLADNKHLDTKSEIRVAQKLADAFLSSFAHL